MVVIHRPGPGNPVAGARNLLDRGKRSIVLDLKDGEDLAVAVALVSRADALIEGYRAGVMERLGLGPEEIRAANRAAGTGQGTEVDAAITDGAAHMMALLMSMRPSGNLSMARGQSLLDGPHWSRTYACACGGWISVQCLEPQFYAVFPERLGLSGDPRFAAQSDPAQWPRLTAALAEILAAQPRAPWAGVLAGPDACVAPVLRPDEAARDPHMAARGVWREGLVPAPAPRFDGAVREVTEPKERGSDGAAIRAELGL